MPRPAHLLLGFLFGILLGLLPGLVSAQTVRVTSGDAWCTAQEEGHGDRAFAYAVHEHTLPARDEVAVDAGRNGGIHVQAHDGDEIELCALVRVDADTEGQARRLAEGVRIETGATIAAVVPRLRADDAVSVSFRLRVPRDTDLDLQAFNGGIGIEGVRGRIRAATTNGGLSLDGVGGDVHGATVNGGLSVNLAGATWDGEGLDVETTNGGIHLTIPEGYSARLETGTVNGPMHLGFPAPVSGDLDDELTVTLGRGGPTVRAVTTNGGVHIDHD